MIESKYDHALVLTGDFVFSIGGANDCHKYMKNVERFSIHSKAWE
jgi:hypothetical protein